MSALRRFLDLSACRVFTIRQQFGFGLLFAALGAASLSVVLLHSAPSLPPVVLLDPKIERFENDYSVFRIRFEWRGLELPSCHIVAWHQTGKWTARCWA